MTELTDSGATPKRKGCLGLGCLGWTVAGFVVIVIIAAIGGLDDTSSSQTTRETTTTTRATTTRAPTTTTTAALTASTAYGMVDFCQLVAGRPLEGSEFCQDWILDFAADYCDLRSQIGRDGALEELDFRAMVEGWSEERILRAGSFVVIADSMDCRGMVGSLIYGS